MNETQAAGAASGVALQVVARVAVRWRNRAEGDDPAFGSARRLQQVLAVAAAELRVAPAEAAGDPGIDSGPVDSDDEGEEKED